MKSKDIAELAGVKYRNGMTKSSIEKEFRKIFAQKISTIMHDKVKRIRSGMPQRSELPEYWAVIKQIKSYKIAEGNPENFSEYFRTRKARAGRVSDFNDYEIAQFIGAVWK